MSHESIRIIRDEHASLAAMLHSLRMMVKRGPGNDPAGFFEVLRAMLFYIDEFPERIHHTKETELLFPPVAARAPHLRQTLEQLEKDHASGEASVREIQHLLLAWELLGDTRRRVFETTVNRYLDFYLEHMRLEETVIIPEAEKVLTDADWQALDAAFATNRDLLSDKYPRDRIYDRLFTRIVMQAPSPIGLGKE